MKKNGDFQTTEPVLTGRDAYINQLKNGKIVSFRGKGNSMTPKIKSGQKCTYSPVLSPDDVKKGDMVYCHVGKYYFTHLVTAIKNENNDILFQISNNHGHVNGWCNINNIFGKVIAIEGKSI